MNLFKHYCLFLLVLAGFSDPVISQYSLTIESSAAVAVPGSTTYKFYVNMLDPTDRMSAVFGNNQTPLTLEADNGVYNNAFNSSWSASGLNPAFLPLFPEMADDTYATIGLTGPAASSGIADAADPSIVEDSGQPITPFFLSDGETFMQANTLTGASYYVLNTAGNGLPDGNLRVLIMQVTTTGEICGTINYQIFPQGDGANQLQLSASFCGAGDFPAGVPPVSGCTDELACNYDPEANEDNGSCIYAEDGYDCDGNCLEDINENDICDVEEIFGCTVVQACNYNPDATWNDGSCDFTSCLALGCTDPIACNFDPEAVYEDGTCEYSTPPYDCLGECLNDSDGDGICDEFETFGCTDMTACNYDLDATSDDGNCTYAEMYYDCDGNCLEDEDGDGVCDINEVPGCNDVNACNYQPEATDNNGTCDYCSCSDAGTDGYGLEVELVADHTDSTGVLAGMLTYRIYATTPNTEDFLSAVFGDDEDPLHVGSTTSFYQHPFGSHLGSNMFPDIYPTFPELEFDSWVTIGLDQGPGSGEVAPQTIESNDFSWVSQFNAGGDIEINDAIGGSWFVLDPNSTSNAVAGDDQRILIMQLTTDGVLSGTVNIQFFNHGSQEDVSRVTLSFDGLSGTSASSCGCTDETACNYDPNATDDDGSCEFAEEYYDCDGNCINDTDGDSICDELEIPGCLDELACNYDASATDNDLDLCEYADMYYDCDGNCLMDTDGDSVCDELEIPGCTDELACNYDVDATDEDGSCWYAEMYYDCGGNCINDTDSDGVCDELEVLGCTDPIACNFDADATDDDGTCWYAEMYYDCAGVCIADTDGDGVCDELELEGCLDETACNFDSSATENNLDLCEYAEMYYDCEGNCLMDTDGDGVCDELEIPGCTDEIACNYNADATEEDGSCLFAEMYYDCEGNCLNDEDGDGVCDELEVLGCTDMGACNYDELATDDDGTCEYETCAGCIDETACNYDEEATIDDGSCSFLAITGGTTIDPLCNGDLGSVTIVSDGGVGIVTYTIGEESNETGVFELLAGVYTVTVNDEAGCSISVEIEIVDPEILTLEATATDETAIELGVGTATTTGGTGTVDVLWYDIAGNSVDPNGLSAGTYFVTAEDENECSVTIQVDVLFNTISVIDALSFNMFPNPSNGDVTIQMPQAFDDVVIKVFDGAGRVVFNSQYSVLQGSTTINLSNIAAGTYNVMLSNNKGTSVRRLSIVR